MADAKPIFIDDLQGGISDDHPAALKPNQVTHAYDVDFWTGNCGGRRNGSSDLVTNLNIVTITSNSIANPTVVIARNHGLITGQSITISGETGSVPTINGTSAVIVADPDTFTVPVNVTGPGGTGGTFLSTRPVIGMFHHTPTNAPSGDLLVYVSTAGEWRTRTVASVDATLSPLPRDFFVPTVGVDAVSLHGNLIIACKNDQARAHVYDGTTLRRASLPAVTAAPTAADSGGAGAYVGTRYFRVRWAKQTAGVTVLRSEPSAVLTKAPSGANLTMTVTRPTAPGESETHWEIEESVNNADFYRLATVILATTTYIDTLIAPTTVATTGTLSEDIGAYTPLRSVQWVTVDNDRLITGGDFEDATKASRIQWASLPSATGVGNDERFTLAAGNYIDADGRNSGGLTGLKAFSGKVVGFKLDQIHTLVRGGTGYYPADVIRKMGALPYSVTEGFDAQGRAALYFLDPSSGPAVMGGSGTVSLTPHMRRTWLATINRDATVRVCSAVYYADKQQVWWHISTTGNNTPNLRWVYHTQTGGVTYHTLVSAVSACAMWIYVPTGKQQPMCGKATALATYDIATITKDETTDYRAYIRTRAYTIGSLLDRGGVSGGLIEADRDDFGNGAITVTVIRDYGAEPVTVTASLQTSGTETVVIVPLDDALLSEAKVVQFEISDVQPAPIAGSTAVWQLHRMAFRLRPEGRT